MLHLDWWYRLPRAAMCGVPWGFSKQLPEPSYLRRHLQMKHANVIQKPRTFFKSKLEELQRRPKKLHFFSYVWSTKDALRASYLLSSRIARNGLPHTIAEEVCLPAATEMAGCMVGEKEAKKVRHDSSIQYHCVALHWCNVRRHPGYISQLCSSRRVYRYDKPGQSGVFMRTKGIDWTRCVGNCSDGAKSMTGKHTGLIAHSRKVCPPIQWLHCIDHREALAAKNMPADLLSLLYAAVKLVNFIKARPLNSRVFTLLCNEMGSEHNALLLHTEVRRLSCDNVLTRLLELRHKLQQSFEDSSFHLASSLHDQDFLKRLACLGDIF